MKNNLTRLFLVYVALLTISGTESAKAQDLPLLTWEKGKIQSVVLGGGDSSSRWEVFLKSQGGQLLKLNGSTANEKGFIVYRLNLPRDIDGGAYSIVTAGDGKPETEVAAVQIIDMQRYEITQIPGDLLFFLMALAFVLASLGALRGERFRQIILFLSTSPKERYLFGEPSQDFIEHVHRFAPLERARIKIYEQLPDSFFKFLLKSDSRGTHLNFPWLWAQLPVLSIFLAATFAISTNEIIGDRLMNQSLIVLIAIVFIGSLDIYSGILASIAYFAVNVWLLSEFSLSAIFLSAVEAQLFYLPALLSTFFSTIVMSQPQQAFAKSMAKLVFEWISPALNIHLLFVISRSLSGSIKTSAALEIMIISALLIGRIVNSYLADHRIFSMSKVAVVEEVEFDVKRLLSPISALVMYSIFTLLFYLWTGRGWPALIIAGFISLPLFLLLARPTYPKLGFMRKLRRQPLIEILSILFLVYLATELLFIFPVITESSPILFITLGMSPVVIYSIITYLSDLGVKVNRSLEDS